MVDNFLKDPLSIREFALSLEYKPSPKGIYSGKRTDTLRETHKYFFHQVCTKVLDCMSIPYIEFQADLRFHITGEEFGDSGWIHIDDNVTLAGIVYLNPQCRDINNGTSIYRLNNFEYTPTLNGEMRHAFMSGVDNDEVKTSVNQNYTETVKIGGVFNRLVTYDARQLHAGAGYFGDTHETSRLTMLVFFNKIINPEYLTPLQRAERLSRV